MADELYIHDVLIPNGQGVYIDDDETARVYNDGGVLKLQIKVAGVWVDQQSWGA